MLGFVLFFKQKTAYDMRISDWSSDVCSSDLNGFSQDSRGAFREMKSRLGERKTTRCAVEQCCADAAFKTGYRLRHRGLGKTKRLGCGGEGTMLDDSGKHGPGFEIRQAHNGNNPFQCCRSEEHTSELQSLMRISYAVLCLKKKNI